MCSRSACRLFAGTWGGPGTKCHHDPVKTRVSRTWAGGPFLPDFSVQTVMSNLLRAHLIVSLAISDGWILLLLLLLLLLFIYFK